MTTYAVLTVVVLALVAAICLPALRRLRPGPLVGTAAALLVLTAVFDSAIVGYGLTVYDETRILGVRVGAAPIEDFGYTIAAVMLVPALWTWFGRSGARRGTSTARHAGATARGRRQDEGTGPAPERT